MNPPLSSKEVDILIAKKDAPIMDPIIKKQDSIAPPSSESTLHPEVVSTMTVNLKATPLISDLNSTIIVEYEITSGTSTVNDWVGLFSTSANNKQYVTYYWRGKDEKKGTIQFPSPLEYGEYEFRYFPNRSYTHVSVSNKIKVGPEFVIESKFTNDQKKIIVHWKQLSGNTYPKQWIGLYRKQQSNNKNYVIFEHANKVELTFDCPVKPGEYEFRFFTNSYIDVAKSEMFHIQGEDKITAAYHDDNTIHVSLDLVSVDPNTEKVWVGLYYITEESHKRFRRYQIVTERKGTIKFKSPNTPQTYEARLFTNGSYDFVIKSNSFIVPKH